jgi:proline racemase
MVLSPDAPEAADESFVNQSLIGTRFTGAIVETTPIGDISAVIPAITGRHG